MEFFNGALAAAGATVFTNPIDVVKTRFQLQGELKSKGHYAVHYKSFFHAFYVIVKTDGILALQKGFSPAVWFQIVLNGSRLGLFEWAEKNKWTKDEKTGKRNILNTVLLGSFAGVTGAFLGSPFYLVKTHLQAKAKKNISVGHQHSHDGMVQGFKSIYKTHGIAGLWRGWFGNCCRLAVGSCSQLTVFHLTREYLDENVLFAADKSLINRVIAGAAAGTAVAVFMNPVDVVATRMYNQGVDQHGRGILYKSFGDCFIKLIQTEGVHGLYKGFIPQWSRIGPHSILTLVFWDILKDLQKVYFPKE